MRWSRELCAGVERETAVIVSVLQKTFHLLNWVKMSNNPRLTQDANKSTRFPCQFSVLRYTTAQGTQAWATQRALPWLSSDNTCHTKGIKKKNDQLLLNLVQVSHSSATLELVVSISTSVNWEKYSTWMAIVIIITDDIHEMLGTH